MNAGVDVELFLDVQHRERGVHDLLVHLVGEVVVQLATVDQPLAGAGHQAHARDGFLATAQASAGSDVWDVPLPRTGAVSEVNSVGVSVDSAVSVGLGGHSGLVCHLDVSFCGAYCATCEISNGAGCCAAWGCSGPA